MEHIKKSSNIFENLNVGLDKLVVDKVKIPLSRPLRGLRKTPKLDPRVFQWAYRISFQEAINHPKLING